MEQRNALAVLGVPSDQEAAYERIIGHGALTLDELADHWRDLAATRVGTRDLLSALENLGLIEVVVGPPNRYRAAPADAALDALASTEEQRALDRRTRLAEARTRISVLSSLHAESRHMTTTQRSQVIEIVQGREAILRRAEALWADASQQIRIIDRPPYADPRAEQFEASRARGAGIREGDFSESQLASGKLGQGVTVRAVYDVTSFDLPGRVASVGAAVRSGERARVMGDSPVKLLLCDDRVALMPFRETTTLESALVVYPCALLEIVIALFEYCWEVATPFGVVSPRRHRLRTEHAHEILALMALGMPDQTIARNLDMGYRTLQKRISSLLDETGVATRFELGMRAAELGWVAPGRWPRTPK